MIAAIYARKSTEQNGVAEDAKSVTRQVQQARAYAEKKGWIVAEPHLYVDDGISGAEFGEKRDGYIRLMKALKPRPPFQALIMMEPSRLGREMIKTAYALQQLMGAGVRVFYYLQDREHTFETATDKFMGSAVSFADEIEREKAALRTYDAMKAKARRGEVCGGLVYGYDNEPVLIGGKRAHVKRVIHEDQAAVVRRIFALCAAGKSLKTIAKAFNAEAIPPPRPRRPGTERLCPSWAPSAIRAMLFNPLYRGLLIWNKTQTLPTREGVRKKFPVPESEWIQVPAPDLAIVTEPEWQAAHDRLTMTRESYLRTSGGKLFGRPANGLESNYLLVGNSLCGQCGGSLCARPHFAQGARCYRYACGTHRDRGPHACSNALELPMRDMDREVLAVVLKKVLHPSVLIAAVRSAVLHARRGGGDRARQHTAFAEEITTLEGERARLAKAIAAGGPLPSLLAELTQREARLKQLHGELAGLDQQAAMTDLDLKRMEKELAASPRFTEWQRMLTGHVPQARQLLRLILGGKRLRFTPKLDHGQWVYEFTGQAVVGKILSGLCVTGTDGVPNGI